MLATAALSLGVLTACGASSPPAEELAHELIDAARGPDGQPLSQAERDCMNEQVDEFELTEVEAQGFDGLDDVFEKAANGQEQALQIVARFEGDLERCRGLG